MAITNMRPLALLLLLLLNTVSCTSDVTERGESSGSTAAPRYGYNKKDPRDVLDNFYNRPIRDNEPGHTESTDVTTSYLTTESQEPTNKYTIDYQEESRRARSDVTIQLLPLLDLSDRVGSERIMVAIEYNKKIRRIRKSFPEGIKVLLRDNTVYVTTDITFPVDDRSNRFGYTIDYYRRGRHSTTKTYPVYMEVRAADEF